MMQVSAYNTSIEPIPLDTHKHTNTPEKIIQAEATGGNFVPVLISFISKVHPSIIDFVNGITDRSTYPMCRGQAFHVNDILHLFRNW